MKHAFLPLSVLLAALFCASCAFAQIPPLALPLTGKIAHVTVTGTKNISIDTVRAVLALKPGDAYTPEATAKDTASIKSLGVFNTVSAAAVPAPTGIDLTYTVIENPVVTAIKITADTPDKLPSVPAAELIAQMKTSIGQVLNTTVLVQDVNALFNHSTGYFWKQGYLTDVNNDINIEPKNGVLTIPLNEYRVHSIKITGNSRVKTADILAQMHTKIGDIYNYNALRRDEYSIYEMGGFKQVGDLTYDSTPPGKIDITLPVVEQAAATGVLDEKQGKVIPFAYDPLSCPFPVIQVSVNGHTSLPFIVDTGTSYPLLLDPWAAKELGLKVTSTVEKNAQDVPYQRTAIQSVVMKGVKGGDLSFNTREAAILDLSLLNQLVFSQRVAGMVGLPMLAASTSRFDFAAKTLTIFTAPHPPLHIPRGTTLPIRSSPDGTITVRATLASETYADLILDTGSDSTQISLSALGLVHPTAAAYGNTCGRLDGIYVCPTLRLLKLALGELSIPNVVVGTLPAPTRLSLGMDVLAGYRLTLDGPNGQVILEPTASGRYVKGWSDLNIQQTSGSWMVGALRETSPARLAGLQAGDKIVTANGVNVGGLTPAQAQHLLAGVAGKPLQVKVQRDAAQQEKSMTVSWVPLDVFSAPRNLMFGLSLEKAPVGPWVVVDAAKGCPGEQAGLRAGDKITHVNGESVMDIPISHYQDLVENIVLILEIERAGVAKPFTVRLSAAK